MCAAPAAQERLHLTDKGRVRLQPWREGTADLVFDPVDLLGQLAVLVPIARRPIRVAKFRCNVASNSGPVLCDRLPSAVSPRHNVEPPNVH